MDMIYIWGNYNITGRRLGEISVGPATFTSGIENCGACFLYQPIIITVVSLRGDRITNLLGIR
jgi:hypothetical protein